MSFQVNVAQVQQYKDVVEHLLQQMDSRFRPAVTVRSDYRGKGIKFIEQIGAVTATKRTTRHADVVPVSAPHDARWFFPEDYDVTEFVDDQDKLRMLFDPTSYYAESFRMAHSRKIDDVIIEAFFGTSQTGENGTTATAFPTATQQIAAGGTGMTVAKLRTARQKLRAAEVPEDEMLYCALTAEEENDLLGEIQVISLDYNDRPVLVDGRVRSFMGFNFIHSERLLLSGAERRCPAWAKSGMHLGLLKDVAVDIGPRRDKGLTVQVYACASYGASRTQELKVVEILCA